MIYRQQTSEPLHGQCHCLKRKVTIGSRIGRGSFVIELAVFVGRKGNDVIAQWPGLVPAGDEKIPDRLRSN